MKSWKTTLAGVGAILAAFGGALTVLFDGNAATNPDWTAVLAAVMAGIGLITAKDSKVTGGTIQQ